MFIACMGVAALSLAPVVDLRVGNAQANVDMGYVAICEMAVICGDVAIVYCGCLACDWDRAAGRESGAEAPTVPAPDWEGETIICSAQCCITSAKMRNAKSFRRKNQSLSWLRFGWR